MHRLFALMLCLVWAGSSPALADDVGQPAEAQLGEQLDPADYGPGIVEDMDVALARDREARLQTGKSDHRGRWAVPSRGAIYYPHSGTHYLINKSGDTRMGIGFGEQVHLHGAYFSGQGGKGAWTTGVRVIGYHDGQETARTDWFTKIGTEPTWFEMNLTGVDRVIIESKPVMNGCGWYALDDLSFTPAAQPGQSRPATVVLDFEDCAFRQVLTDTSYAGLIWESGTGGLVDGDGVPAPQPSPYVEEETRPDAEEGPVYQSRAATQPIVGINFQGVMRGDAGSWSYPPDTCGAIGPSHFVEVVNRNFAVYNRSTGAELVNMSLGSFLPGSNGDPRVLYDQHSSRWIVIVTDFDTRIFLAVSTTANPTGSWFKTSFVISQGSDSGSWPDYPTLGVDQNGIYTAAYMVGSGGMSIFAVDKAPVISAMPYLGTVTAFRGLTWEGAIQPVHTYGTPSGEYCISRRSSTSLRVRRINPPLTGPSLSELGSVTIPYHSSPPEAPALGSGTDLDTVGHRLMNAVYRDGSIWTAHCVNASGRAGARWYEVDVGSLSLVQNGLVADGSVYYFFPSIMVNSRGDAVMGFTGSDATRYAAAYYTGRSSTDPAGEMAAPVLLKAGTAAQNNIDDYGRNRWGDYSLCSLDPNDELTMWTVQEYGHSTNVWGTWIGALAFEWDCNSNGVPDSDDIAGGTSEDCDTNGQPDECQPDCNGNSVADTCDITHGTSADCNENTVPDECDLSQGTSVDCQPNGIPDECETDCNQNGVPDDCDITAGTSLDCQPNGIPDSCDINFATSMDCNANDVPDECDLAAGSSFDCNNNTWLDECDIAGGTSNDCQPNGIPDECDIAGGGGDYNTNGIPDDCEAREIQNVGSCHDHGSAGEFCVDLGIGSGFRATGDNVEPRKGSVDKLVLDLNLPVWSVGASVSCQYHTYTGTVTPSADGTPIVNVEFDPALPNNDCCTISLTGDVTADYAVAALLGDADRNLDVNSLDYSAVKLRLGQPVDETNARYDINADGDITSLDYSSIKLNLGAVLPSCP